MPIYAYGLEAVRLVWQFGGPAYVFAHDGWVTSPLPPGHRRLELYLDHHSLTVAIDDEFRRWLLLEQHRRVYELGLSGPPALIPDDWRYQLVVGDALDDVRSYVRTAAARLRAQLWPPKPLSFATLKAEMLRLEQIRAMRLADPSSFVHITSVY